MSWRWWVARGAAMVVLALAVVALFARPDVERVRAVSTSDTQPPASLIPPLEVEQPAPPTRAITSTGDGTLLVVILAVDR